MTAPLGAVVARYDDVARDRGPRTCLSLAVQRLDSAIEWAPHAPKFALADIAAAREALDEAEAAIRDRLAADPPIVPPQRVSIDYGDSRLPARFWAKVYPEPNTGCWLWGGSFYATGYGQTTLDRKSTSAHRAAYLTLVGPVAIGMHLDHLCRVRDCVNPDHLEPVTPRENVLRSPFMGLKTHCPNGHEFTPVNTLWQTNRHGYKTRRCRTCRRAQETRSRRAAEAKKSA